MENSPEPYKSTVALVETQSRPLGVQLVDASSTNKMQDPMDLVGLAHQIQKADEFTRANAGNKLTVIAEQIRFLQEQAKKVLQEAKRDHDLHHAACNMVKKPGQIYHLYERQSGQKYMSLLSPQEWGKSCPHTYLGSYRLEHDQSWTPLEQLEQRSEEIKLVDKILNAQMSITDSPHFRLADQSSGAMLKELKN